MKAVFDPVREMGNYNRLVIAALLISFAGSVILVVLAVMCL